MSIPVVYCSAERAGERRRAESAPGSGQGGDRHGGEVHSPPVRGVSDIAIHVQKAGVWGGDRHPEMVGYRPGWHGPLTGGDRRRPTPEWGVTQQGVTGDTRIGAW